MLKGRHEVGGGLWDGLEEGMVWAGIGKGRGKEICTAMIFPIVQMGRRRWAWMVCILNRKDDG